MAFFDKCVKNPSRQQDRNKLKEKNIYQLFSTINSRFVLNWIALETSRFQEPCQNRS